MLLNLICVCVNLVFLDERFSLNDINNNWPSLHGYKMVDLPSMMKRQVLNEKCSDEKAGFNASSKVGLVSKLGQLTFILGAKLKSLQ